MDPFHVPGRGAAYVSRRPCSDRGGERRAKTIDGSLGKTKATEFSMSLNDHDPLRNARRALRAAAEGEKIWRWTLWVLNPCNPLKSHKTAKGIFGNPWTETA